jgi:hypothetical protein
VAVHAPRNFRGSDPRNFHAHLLATTREVSHEGLGRKTTFDLNEDERRKLGLGPGVRELLYVRQRWAEVANMALESAHVDARIDHRSLAAQGITREPKLWIPRVPYEIERHGGRSVVAEQIRENHRARHEPSHEPQDIARQSIENWRQYRREKLTSSEREPAAEDSARRWAQYRRDALELGEARAAEIHLRPTPAAERERDWDFGL